MTAPGRVPSPRTSFVGRERELADARRLLHDTRLLTLTGPGGAGKTRLSIALASRAEDDFRDGVHFVPLATIRDPALVGVAIAQAVGLQDTRAGPLLEHLGGYLAERDVLLVLDNFEQVLPAAEFVHELLSRSSAMRIVVTSRSPLHVSGEQEFPVPALKMTDGRSVESVAAGEATQLFAARAAALLPGFTIDEHNASPIARIVQRLDGLPLAIELAAARVKVLPPEAILDRLENSLNLLVSPGRDVPDRQRTLRATIAWSYDLLSEAARRLLTACSVFRGGIALANVEAVYAAALDSRVPVLDSLQELVDHSLLRLASPSARYSMLETVREFAAEQLPSRPECSAIHAAHAAQFSRLADGLARPPRWPAKDGLDFLELEHDNFRAALDWYRHHDPSAGLLLANRLTAFWSARGHFSEGRWRLAELLEAVPDTDPGWVDGMNGAAWLATDQGDSVTAIDLLDRSVAGAHAAGDTVGEATALFFRGRSRLTTADRAGGSADMARAMELQRAAGDEAGLAAALWFAALPEMFEGQVDVAAERLVRSAQLSDALGIPALAARSWQLLGVCRVEQGDLSAAQAALERAVPAIVDIGDRFGIPVGLSALAGLAAKRGRARTAVKLAGAAAAQEEVHQSDRPIALRMFLDAWLAPAQTQLGAAAAPVFDEGRKLRLDEAVALGLGDDDDRLTRDTSSGLTRRESEVAGLVARGLTNREIAGQLHLSVRTVEVHVDHILTKLGFRTRTQLAGWAHQQGVLPGKDT